MEFQSVFLNYFIAIVDDIYQYLVDFVTNYNMGYVQICSFKMYLNCSCTLF